MLCIILSEVTINTEFMKINTKFYQQNLLI